jgi:hypothetical protein
MIALVMLQFVLQNPFYLWNFIYKQEENENA